MLEETAISSIVYGLASVKKDLPLLLDLWVLSGWKYSGFSSGRWRGTAMVTPDGNDSWDQLRSASVKTSWASMVKAIGVHGSMSKDYWGLPATLFPWREVSKNTGAWGIGTYTEVPWYVCGVHVLKGFQWCRFQAVLYAGVNVSENYRGNYWQNMWVSVVMAVDIPLSSFSPAWGASHGTVNFPGSISKKIFNIWWLSVLCPAYLSLSVFTAYESLSPLYVSQAFYTYRSHDRPNSYNSSWISRVKISKYRKCKVSGTLNLGPENAIAPLSPYSVTSSHRVPCTWRPDHISMWEILNNCIHL